MGPSVPHGRRDARHGRSCPAGMSVCPMTLLIVPRVVVGATGDYIVEIRPTPRRQRIRVRSSHSWLLVDGCRLITAAIRSFNIFLLKNASTVFSRIQFVQR